MCWYRAFISLKQSYSSIVIIFILVFSSVKAMPDKMRSSNIQTFESHLNSQITATTYKTLTIVKTINHTSSPIRLLNEASHDPGIKISSIRTPIEDDDEIESFLKIDNEELINNDFTIDGSGDTTELTSKTTTITELITSTSRSTSSTTAPMNITLSQDSTFTISVDCTSANDTLNQILEQFKSVFGDSYKVTYDQNTLHCPRSLKIDVSFTFTTSNNITILNNLVQILYQIVSSMGIELKSVDRCNTNETVLVENVTSCYLIDLCNLCGTNPPRGICFPENNISRCECFYNQNDISIIYTGEFCLPQTNDLTTSKLSSWVPIIVGILAGIAGLFCMITCGVLVITYLRHRSRKQKEKIEANPIWHLPRSSVPTNVQRLSTSSNTTIIQTNPRDMLVPLSSDRISIESIYDPIDELDAIFDDEDAIMTYRE